MFCALRGDGSVVASVASKTLYATILTFKAPSRWASCIFLGLTLVPATQFLDGQRTPQLLLLRALRTPSLLPWISPRYHSEWTFLQGTASRRRRSFWSWTLSAQQHRVCSITSKLSRGESLLSCDLHSWRIYSHSCLSNYVWFFNYNGFRCDELLEGIHYSWHGRLGVWWHHDWMLMSLCCLLNVECILKSFIICSNLQTLT